MCVIVLQLFRLFLYIVGQHVFINIVLIIPKNSFSMDLYLKKIHFCYRFCHPYDLDKVLFINGARYLYFSLMISEFFFLRDNPSERLGYQKNGLKDIQKHKYVCHILKLFNPPSGGRLKYHLFIQWIHLARGAYSSVIFDHHLPPCQNSFRCMILFWILSWTGVKGLNCIFNIYLLQL